MTNQAIHRNIVNELFIVRASIKKKLIKDINLLFQIRIHILHSSPQFFFMVHSSSFQYFTSYTYLLVLC